MNSESGKIESFKDLNSWKESHNLVLMVYKETETFPTIEMFGLTSQLRRAAVSLTSNIAEGFSRNTYKDKLQFYSVAMGSLTEIENQLTIAKDLNYIEPLKFSALNQQLVTASKLLQGLIKKTKVIIRGS